MHEASDGKVAGVAVLLKAGAANAALQRIWDHRPKTAGKEEGVAGVEVNPAGLLLHDAAYHTYMGSLTAPPGSEGVVVCAEDSGGDPGRRDERVRRSVSA